MWISSEGNMGVESSCGKLACDNPAISLHRLPCLAAGCINSLHFSPDCVVHGSIADDWRARLIQMGLRLPHLHQLRQAFGRCLFTLCPVERASARSQRSELTPKFRGGVQPQVWVHTSVMRSRRLRKSLVWTEFKPARCHVLTAASAKRCTAPSTPCADRCTLRFRPIRTEFKVADAVC